MNPVQIGVSDLQYLVDDLRYVTDIPGRRRLQSANSFGLSSWRYPELGWLLSVTEPLVLLDQGRGTV